MIVVVYRFIFVFELLAQMVFVPLAKSSPPNNNNKYYYYLLLKFNRLGAQLQALPKRHTKHNHITIIYPGASTIHFDSFMISLINEESH
jgi:hypothetical protein